jgi:murein L,D-transpeptidase YcbB/YkuD
MPSVVPEEADPTLFDATLEQAVNRFQERHGLAVDGTVGPITLEVLNVPAEARVRQVILNMERLRHRASTFGDRHIVVNIPNYQLNVMEQGQSVLNMRVVVGMPTWQTPTFQSTMTHLVVNPYWVVPEGITRREIIPKIIQNPAYLKNQNMEMLRGHGQDTQIINPANIDWSAVSNRHFPYRFRQRPGSRNALGRIKFKFPNRFHVYMHDTPARSLFAKPRRAFSHGCVRLERPVDLAAYLLQDDPAWTSERIERTIKSGRHRYVNLLTPIDVRLIYQTAWVDADGRVQLRPDIYGLDKKHQKILCGVSYRLCA